MFARIIKIDPNNICEQDIHEAVALLKNGDIIGYPTETVYGLGGDVFNSTAIERIQNLKNRRARKPFLLLVASGKDIYPLVREVPEVAKKIMAEFWPGPITLVFKASESMNKSNIACHGLLGLRVSPDKICKKLLQKLGGPLISTSANPEGGKPAQSAREVAYYFGNVLQLIIDGGERKEPIPSTVLNVAVDPPELIREGTIKKEQIQSVVGEIHG